MNKYYYKLITAGTRVHRNKDGESVTWKTAYYSDIKKVYALDEETARNEIYAKLKAKWTGFRLFPKYNG